MGSRMPQYYRYGNTTLVFLEASNCAWCQNLHRAQSFARNRWRRIFGYVSSISINVH